MKKKNIWLGEKGKDVGLREGGGGGGILVAWTVGKGPPLVHYQIDIHQDR